MTTGEGFARILRGQPSIHSLGGGFDLVGQVQIANYLTEQREIFQNVNVTSLKNVFMFLSVYTRFEAFLDTAPLFGFGSTAVKQKIKPS